MACILPLHLHSKWEIPLRRRLECRIPLRPRLECRIPLRRRLECRRRQPCRKPLRTPALQPFQERLRKDLSFIVARAVDCRPLLLRKPSSKPCSPPGHLTTCREHPPSRVMCRVICDMPLAGGTASSHQPLQSKPKSDKGTRRRRVPPRKRRCRMPYPISRPGERTRSPLSLETCNRRSSPRHQSQCSQATALNVCEGPSLPALGQFGILRQWKQPQSGCKVVQDSLISAVVCACPHLPTIFLQSLVL